MPTASDTALLESGRQLHRQGKLPEAERIYREILTRQPHHPEALHLLALLALRAGHVDAGIELLQRSLYASPAQPTVLLDLARALTQVRRADAAIAAYDSALALKPGLAEALFERGNALMLFGRPRAALETYDKFLALAPAHAGAWSNRGNALQDLGRLAEAVESYDRALKHAASAEAYNNRGNALRTLRRLDEALASYDRALQLNPQLADCHNSRGTVLRDLGRLQDALAAFNRALELRPDFVEALNHCGNALRDLSRPEAALQCYERVLALDPGYAEALSNRGNALVDLRRHAEALECYDQALRALPDQPDVLANRASVVQELGRHTEAAACFEHLLQVSPGYDYALGGLLQANLHVCAWQDYAERTAQVEAAVAARQTAIHPFSMMAVSASTAAQLRSAQLHAARIKPQQLPSSARRTQTSRRKLRIAYVSADFREHAVSYLLAGVFEQHDRGQFETTGISLIPPEDSVMGRRVRAAFDRFVHVSGRSDREIADLIQDLEVDVAVDLMGYTQHARPAVFAHRPAPVQVSYLGYPGTMGAPFMDYIVADEFVIPADSRTHYAEQVVNLPYCFQANDDRRPIGPTPSRSEAGLPDEAFVWCCFNNSYKLNPPVFDVWMRLLHEVPGSVLWLLGDRQGSQANLLSEAAARGIVGDRLIFADRLPYAQHLGRFALADLFLDTLPYNAGTTASDALWTGVPVLTCVGQAFAARMAGSLLCAVGLPELVTASLQEYESTALRLARQPAELATLRARLAQNRAHSPLFDTAGFCRHLEAAYLEMHERARRGEAPIGFTVPPRHHESLDTPGHGYRL